MKTGGYRADQVIRGEMRENMKEMKHMEDKCTLVDESW
jgi:hypothetical protein